MSVRPSIVVVLLATALTGACGLGSTPVTPVRSSTPSSSPAVPPVTPDLPEPSRPMPPDPARDGDLDGLTASFYGLSRVDVDVPVAEVEQTLGVQFVEGGIQVEHGSCFAVVESRGRIGVVVDGGLVRAYLIRAPGLPLTSFTDVPIEVGDPIDLVGRAFPQWYAGEYSQYASRFLGPRIAITPPQLAGVLQGSGRSALFEADEDGTIKQIRVGSTTYVDHVDYCTTPD